MWPTLAQVDTPVGTVPIGTYGLLVMIGVASGFAAFSALGRRMGLGMGQMVGAFSGALFGGFLGAKLLFGVAVEGHFTVFSGGLAFYGGILGGLVAGVLTARVMGLPLLKIADAAAPALVLGHAIGRLGCFFAGCCHGAPVPSANPGTALLREGLLQGNLYAHAHAPWLSNAFAGGASRIVDTPLYPTQLWLSAGSLVIFAGLWSLSRHRAFDGQVAAVALMAEPVLRTTVELFRADHRGYAISWQTAADSLPAGLAAAGSELPGSGLVTVGLTTSQGVGLILMAGGAALFWWRRSHGIAAEQVVEDAWVDELAPPGDDPDL